jgi:hypothetical protein
VHTVLKLIPLCLTIMVAAQGQNAPMSPPERTDLVQRALAAELQAAQDSSHPMRYLLRKSSPRLTTTKDMIETSEGSVAMLVSVNDQPPSAVDARKERQRLDNLLADPGKQRHRKQVQDEDMARAQKVLRVLPTAFEYQYVGAIATGSGNAARFVFTPNPNFNPPDLETEVLTAMIGEIWIDPAQGRVMHLQGKLQQDVDFGWGVLGRLYKGGWITIDQADVGGGVWRVVKFQMAMSARILIRTRAFDTREEESHFTPVPADLDYRRAIEMLKAGSDSVTPATTGR